MMTTASVSIGPLGVSRSHRLLRLVNIMAVVLPPAGLVAALALLWGTAFGPVYLWVGLAVYLLSGFGVTIGFHRLFTHRSFTTSAPVRFALGVMGSMAIEGPLFKWVGDHRKHHHFSDSQGDPHSPQLHGGGIRGTLAGLWHAHVGWMLNPETADLTRYVGDLRKDRASRVVNRCFVLWAGVGLILPAVLCALIMHSWMALLLGFLWCGLVRVMLVHHITWSINSVCHLWGARPYRTGDESRNNIIFGYLGMGEGWHNNHHAFPNSARHGLRWWELDGSYAVIRMLKLAGLVWNVKLPDRATMQSRRRVTG